MGALLSLLLLLCHVIELSLNLNLCLCLPFSHRLVFFCVQWSAESFLGVLGQVEHCGRSSIYSFHCIINEHLHCFTFLTPISYLFLLLTCFYYLWRSYNTKQQELCLGLCARVELQHSSAAHYRWIDGAGNYGDHGWITTIFERHERFHSHLWKTPPGGETGVCADTVAGWRATL